MRLRCSAGPSGRLPGRPHLGAASSRPPCPSPTASAWTAGGRSPLRPAASPGSCVAAAPPSALGGHARSHPGPLGP
eukprot:8278660-Alexandrium_andersonii.AAC.1